MLNSELKRLVDEYVKWVKSDDYHEDGELDWMHYIFEEAVMHFHGKDIFTELNKINE